MLICANFFSSGNGFKLGKTFHESLQIIINFVDCLFAKKSDNKIHTKLYDKKSNIVQVLLRATSSRSIIFADSIVFIFGPLSIENLDTSLSFLKHLGVLMTRLISIVSSQYLSVFRKCLNQSFLNSQ